MIAAASLRSNPRETDNQYYTQVVRVDNGTTAYESGKTTDNPLYLPCRTHWPMGSTGYEPYRRTRPLRVPSANRLLFSNRPQHEPSRPFFANRFKVVAQIQSLSDSGIDTKAPVMVLGAGKRHGPGRNSDRTD